MRRRKNLPSKFETLAWYASRWKAGYKFGDCWELRWVSDIPGYSYVIALYATVAKPVDTRRIHRAQRVQMFR